MFAINHAATALVIKRRFPTARMPILLLAVQTVELLWVALNLIGVETTTTNATVHSVRDIHLIHMPWSHSIATTTAIAVAAWILIRYVFGHPKTAAAVALGVASHIVLDLVIHSPDIAIAPCLSSTKLGLGLYDSMPVVAFLIELGFGIACWWIYRGSGWLLVAIVAFNGANLTLFLPGIVGIEAGLAGHPTLLILVILAQIVVTLCVVGLLSRSWRVRRGRSEGLWLRMPSAPADWRVPPENWRDPHETRRGAGPKLVLDEAEAPARKAQGETR